MKDVQVLKKELLELDVQLKRFKQELLTTRVGELERIVRAPTGRRSPTMDEVRMSMAQDVN